jgi:hypothetical protein
MSRFTPNHKRPEHLVASIVALAEQSNRLALDAAMEAARADATGRPPIVIDQICRLAVGAGVAGGELAWLEGELVVASTDLQPLNEAGVAVAGMESCMLTVGHAIRELAEKPGAPIELNAASEALRRVADQLAALLGRLQFCA